jgi:hypothetical protein
MGIFEIDDPSIDVAALEERVKAAIEAKRGVRFTDEELAELRDAELVPRMRREDLPRGWLTEVSEVRSRVPFSPLPELGAAPIEALYGSGSSGLKGGVLRFVRRLMRPFYRSTLNLETSLLMVIDGIGEQAAWLSETTGQLDRWHDRDLHLFHNLVTEVTALRLQQTHMQDRINELIRQLDALKERERALESLTVGERPSADAKEV